MSFDSTTRRKVPDVWWATALPRSVFPNTKWTVQNDTLWCLFTCSTQVAWVAVRPTSQPTESACRDHQCRHVFYGAFGLMLSDNTPTTVWTLWLSNTEHPRSNWSLSMNKMLMAWLSSIISSRLPTDLSTSLFVIILMWLESCLILDELLLHEQKVLNLLQFQQL